MVLIFLLVTARYFCCSFSLATDELVERSFFLCFCCRGSETKLDHLFHTLNSEGPYDGLACACVGASASWSRVAGMRGAVWLPNGWARGVREPVTQSLIEFSTPMDWGSLTWRFLTLQRGICLQKMNLF